MRSPSSYQYWACIDPLNPDVCYGVVLRQSNKWVLSKTLPNEHTKKYESFFYSSRQECFYALMKHYNISSVNVVRYSRSGFPISSSFLSVSS